MSLITKIAWRRLRGNPQRSVFLAAANLLSMLMISFFAFFKLQTETVSGDAYRGLPFGTFLGSVRSCMDMAVAFLIVITLVTVRIHCRVRSEENRGTLAVLTAVGAAARQKRGLILTEILVLYLPTTVLGVAGGCYPGLAMGRRFQGLSEGAPKALAVILLAVFLVSAGMLLISLCHFLPEWRFGKQSVIGAVRRYNARTSEERHGYRQSRTFKNQSLIRRLAKKSADYHAGIYNGIALCFFLAALYPLLAILMFLTLGDAQVVLDANPHDGADTAAAVLSAVNGILAFFGVCFLVLTAAGVSQAVLMMRAQMAERKRAARAYMTLGMTAADFNRMIKYELMSVYLRVFIYLVVGAIIVNACFAMVVGT